MASKLHVFIDTISGTTDRIKTFKWLSEKTKLQSGWFGFAFFLFVVSFVFFGIGAEILTNIVGVVYPAYQSFKAIESENEDDDTQWLVYWAIFCPLFIVDGLYDYILFWIPFYYPIKLMFIIFLFSPWTKGALRIYNRYFKKFIVKPEQPAQLDEAQKQKAKEDAKLKYQKQS